MARCAYSKGHHHDGTQSVSRRLGDKAVDECAGGESIQHFSMVRAAVRAERDGPVWNNEGVFSFGSGFRVSGEETGRKCIVGGGESIDGDGPTTVCKKGVDALT